MKEPANATTREVLTALAILYGGTFALLGLSLAVPAVRGSLQGLLAVLLLVTPALVLRKRGLRVEDLHDSPPSWKRTLALAGATMAVVFAVFAGGFHLFQTVVMDAQPDFRLERLSRWGETLEGPPAAPCDRPDDALVWTARQGVWIVPPPEGRLSVVLRAEPEPIRVGRTLMCERGHDPRTGRIVRAGPDGAFTLPPGKGLWLPLERATDGLRLELRLDGRPIPAGRIHLGQWRETAGDDGLVEADRSMWWILTFIIVHLGLVALPEEWFFRGYLQPRLDARFGRPSKLLGARVGWGLVLASLAFALLHPILVPGPHRLLVFFPSLLFGWLRARSGDIGAAVIVHAGANLLQQVLSRLYV